MDQNKGKMDLNKGKMDQNVMFEFFRKKLNIAKNIRSNSRAKIQFDLIFATFCVIFKHYDNFL